MRADRNRRLDSDTAERLIAGDRVEPHQLADLLSWAAGPAHADELVGEEAATLAFRSARIHVVPAHRRRRRRPARRWARLVSVKAAALGLAVAVAGVAVAAGTGVLPGPQWGPAPVLTTTSTVGDNRFGSTTGSSTTGIEPPSPSIPGLCNAYLKQLKPPLEGPQDDGKKTKKVRRVGRAFDALFAAAGGKENAEAYCHGLIGSGLPSEIHRDTSQLPPSPAMSHPPSSSTTPEPDTQDQGITNHPSSSRPTPHSAGPPTTPPGR
jgi:hypothetical protein